MSFWLRWIGALGVLPAAVSLAGLVVLGLAGWLGGELVFVHSMGVKPPPATSRQAAAGSQRRIA